MKTKLYCMVFLGMLFLAIGNPPIVEASGTGAVLLQATKRIPKSSFNIIGAYKNPLVQSPSVITQQIGHFSPLGSHHPDAIPYIVTLKGDKVSRDKVTFYKNISVEVTNPKTEQTSSLPLGISGTQPLIEYGDVNKDYIQDMLISAHTGVGKDAACVRVLAGEQHPTLQKLDMPPSREVGGRFKDGYKADVVVQGKCSTIDLSHRKLIYDYNGI